MENNTIHSIVLGKTNVGKTSFCEYISNKNNICNNTYNSTIGVDLFVYSSTNYKVYFWDTNGNDKYNILLTSFYKKASLAYILFDINDKHFYNSIDDYVNIISQFNKNTKIILVGNKIDTLDTNELTPIYNKILNKYPKYTIFISSIKNNTAYTLPMVPHEIHWIVDITLQDTPVLSLQYNLSKNNKNRSCCNFF